MSKHATRRRLVAAVAVSATAIAMAIPPAVAAPAKDPVTGQVAGYTPTTAEEEAYWYSRYSLMSLTMQSGLGQTFMPPEDMVMAAVQAVDTNMADGDVVMMPAGLALLSRVGAEGDPALATGPMNPADFSTLRWVGGPQSFTTEATAWTVTKEFEWAKQFHVDAHFGTPDSSFGAQERFAGMMMTMLGKMQLKDYLDNPSQFRSSKAGDYAMLIALSDGAAMLASSVGTSRAAGEFTTTTNRYADPMMAPMLKQAADSLVLKVLASRPRGASELSTAIQSLVWYAALPGSRNHAQISTRVNQWAATLARTPVNGPADRAAAIRGLIEAGRTTRTGSYLNAAATAYESLVAGFDATHGVLMGTHRLTSDDIGTIVGGINSARLFLGDRIDQTAATKLFGQFWEGTVNLSGFQVSTPPANLFKGQYEVDDNPELNLRYPTQPMPPMAGGTYGIAPVMAASITRTAHGWKADTHRFDTSGAMHTANEMIWLHYDEVNGFPKANLAATS